MKGTLLGNSESYSAFVTKTYWALEKEEIVNMTIFVLFIFLELRNIRRTYSKYFQKFINHLRLSNQPPSLLFQEFYIHST